MAFCVHVAQCSDVEFPAVSGSCTLATATLPPATPTTPFAPPRPTTPSAPPSAAPPTAAQRHEEGASRAAAAAPVGCRGMRRCGAAARGGGGTAAPSRARQGGARTTEGAWPRGRRAHAVPMLRLTALAASILPPSPHHALASRGHCDESSKAACRHCKARPWLRLVARRQTQPDWVHTAFEPRPVRAPTARALCELHYSEPGTLEPRSEAGSAQNNRTHI